MTHKDINDLETRDYIFKIGDRGKGIQARYDENTDALIFPRAAFDYVFELLKETLSQEPTEDVLERIRAEITHLLNRPSLTHVIGYDKGFIDGIDKVLQIIDRHRGDKNEVN